MNRTITCDIVEKPARSHESWRIIGLIPDGITAYGKAAPGSVHVYGGPKACILDSETDAYVVGFRKSLDTVLQDLADATGCTVTVEDECEGRFGYYNRTFTPQV